METSTSLTNPKASRSAPTVQDEDTTMGTAPPMAALKLTDEEMKSDYVHPSFYTKKGMIVQFINGNCPGTTSMIGGIRLSLTDVRKAPAYVTKYRQQIKSHAVKALNRHFRDMQCGLGANEALCPDDFGMSFSVASLSHGGIQLNPSKRSEAPLFYCVCPALLAPALIKNSDWDKGMLESDVDEAYVLNAYIHLLPLHQRRTYMITKAKEDLAASQAAKGTQAQQIIAATVAKKPKIAAQPTAGNSKASAPLMSRSAADKFIAEVEMLKKEITRLEGQAIPSPPLPPSKPAVWPSRDTCPDLPDDL